MLTRCFSFIRIFPIVVSALFLVMLGVSQFLLPQSENLPPASEEIAGCELELPEDLPPAFAVTLPVFGEMLTLRLEKNRVFGENTRFLVSDGAGAVTEIDPGEDRSYLGWVDGMPGFVVSAVLGKEGLTANIIRPGRESIVISPLADRIHSISRGEVGESRGSRLGKLEATDATPGDDEMAASIGQVFTVFALAAGVGDSPASTATLPPSRVMDVLEYEIGVEIGSRAFFASSAYNGNMARAVASAQSIVGNLDARYLRGAGIKHRLGTVMIRDDAAADPLRDSVTATGAAANAGSSLSAFRNYWNGNAGIVGNTHDLAVYHVLSSPSGLAYVNSVGTSSRYATTGGNGATSWADGTLVHEFGHSWSLAHYDSGKGTFFEAKPRNGSGSNTAGGSDNFISVMHGSGTHNIGRLSTGEADQVYGVRQNKRQFGDVVTNPGPIPPFGRRDDVEASGAPIKIDVAANDIDANNDVLDVRLLDSVSHQGGTISLSPGTGPGGRNELTYTPPEDFIGRDFFHYTVCDTTGRTDWGAVYVMNLPSGVAGVTLFTNANSGGEQVLLPVGLHRQGALNASSVPANTASTVAVPLNFTVRLFRSDSLFASEGFKDLGPGITNLTTLEFDTTDGGENSGGTMNDAVAAVGVNFTGGDGPFVEIYDVDGLTGTPGLYSGIEEEISGGVYRRSHLDLSGIGNNAISSVRVPPGFVVELYDNDPPAGASVTLTETSVSLRGVGFDNRATSMVIRRVPAPQTVEVFGKVDFEGAHDWFTRGRHTLSDLFEQGIANDSINSIRIPDGFRVEVFSQDNFTGQQLTLTESVSDLSALGFGNRITSMSVQLADDDEDGLLDEWEEEYFGDAGATDGDADPDGDGLTNLQEFFAAGDPTKGESTSARLADIRTLLIPAGSEWAFLADGSDQGTAWRESDFDSSVWSVGAAPFGYGDGTETTLIDYGGDDDAKFTTTYFVRKFEIQDLSVFSVLDLGLRRDDGAAVYINGTEVVRDSLPAGALFDTFASDAASEDDETTFFQFSVPKSVLVAGTNTIAVEVHQVNLTSSDMGFDLTLGFDGSPFAFGFAPFTGALVGGLFDRLIDAGSTWNFLDDGSNLGTAWTLPGYDDSAWSIGAGPFGYGDSAEATLIDFGSDPDDKHITTYFRQRFSVDDPVALGAITLGIQRDDGAAVYINGAEVARENLAAGALYNETAVSAVGGADEVAFLEFPILPSTLNAGENTIAVEIHQANVNSSDLRFDLSLLFADTVPGDFLTLQFVRNKAVGDSIIPILESSEDLLNWRQIVSAPTLVGETEELEFLQFTDVRPVTSGGKRYLRLRLEVP